MYATASQLACNHDSIHTSELQTVLNISEELYVAIGKHWYPDALSTRGRGRGKEGGEGGKREGGGWRDGEK